MFPKKCVGCGEWGLLAQTGRYVCEKCEVGLWEEEQICPVCARGSRYGLRHGYCKRPWSMEGVTALWAYEGMARKIIASAKYKFHWDFLRELTSLSVAQLLSRVELAYFGEFLASKPVIVPVPLYPKRERERGFNQSEIISLSLSRIWGLEMKEMLTRIRDTGQQVGKTRESRLKNVEGVFHITPSNPPLKLRGGSVLLVDDVWTTGATMNECAKVLRQAGVRRVWGLVLAR